MTANSASALPLPATLDDVTTDWLSRALSVQYPGVEVRSLHFGTIIEGTGMKVRLLLDYNAAGHAAGLPPTMWIKGAFHEYGKNIRAAFQREVLFYRDVYPENVLEAPKPYFAELDAEAGQGVVLMEDLLARNARFGDPVEPVSPALAAQTLAMLAKLHARWWESPELSRFGERGGSLKEDGVIQRLMQRPSWDAAMALGRADAFPAAIRDRDRVNTALERVLAHNDTLPECLLHGDPHLGNMYYPAADAIGFLDWQRMMRGPWVWDVAYMLCGFLSPEDRRRHEQALLRGYLGELARHGAPAPDFDAAWDLYRAQLFYGIVWTVVPPGTQPEAAITAVSTRFAIAIDDLDGFEAVDRLR